MKYLLIFFLLLTNLISKAQAKLDVVISSTATPVNLYTPSSSATYTTPVSINVWVTNHGTVAFNGTFVIIAKRDTLGGVICDSVASTQVLPVNFTANITLTFTPTPGPLAFKSAGNGNTIVVWPLILSGAGTNGDSSRTTMWVNDPSSVFEFEKNQFKLYPNPVIHNLTIKAQSNNQYKNIIIYDVFARKVKELSFKETIDVSELNPGSYWMIINSEDKSYRINFIKE